MGWEFSEFDFFSLCASLLFFAKKEMNMHIFLIVVNEVRQEYESSWSENSLVGETERLLLLRLGRDRG